MIRDKQITWRQTSKIEIFGYVNGKDTYTYSITSFWNRNMAVPISDRYKGETWLTYHGVCFKLSSVKNAKQVSDHLLKTGKPPRYLKALYPKRWATWSAVFEKMLLGKDLNKSEFKNIKFPVELTDQEYPDSKYAKR